MTERVHALKTWPPFFDAIKRCEKTFEVRKDDRAFGVGDVLLLREWDPGLSGGNFYSPQGEYTGREMRFTVTYVMRGGDFGIERGYCVLGLGPRPAAGEATT